MVEFPNQVQTIFSGISANVSSEIMRRTSVVLLDAKRDPTKRDPGKFEIKEPLEHYVSSNQKELYGYCLTIVQAWINAGMPDGREKVLPTFEPWTRIMGGILGVARIEGFMTNRHLVKAIDEEVHVWSMICNRWYVKYGLKKVTDKDIMAIYIDMDVKPNVPGVAFRANDESRTGAEFVEAVRKKKNAAIEMKIDGRETYSYVRHEHSDFGGVFWLEEAKD
jgi:hypothetical protein